MTTKLKQSEINAGFYIHIPFCVKKCPYCDFYSITELSLNRRFLRALIKEMEMVQYPAWIFDTVYIGGGTPSVLDGQDISDILEGLSRHFTIDTDSEITIEVNPGTVDLNKLKLYQAAGINRINIGVQSFNDPHLAFLGRIHDANTARSVIHQARQAGFENIGLDLIYGLPDQTEDAWIQDLQTAVDFQPEHLSCYMLTFEQGTDMWKDMKKNRFHPLPDSKGADLFEITATFLEENGYTHYEISNFAKSIPENPSAYSSRHNQKYWSFAPYVGFGPSAHSFMEPKRYWNVRSVKEYIDRLSKGNSPIDGEEILTVEQMMIEAVYLGLRKTDGIDIHGFNDKFGTAFTGLFKEVITDLTAKEMIRVDSQSCRLTRKGMVFLNSIAQMFIDNV